MRSFDSKSGMFQALRAFEAAIAYTRAAVLAAHPELREDGPRGRSPLKLDAAGWAADEILTHLTGLAGSLARYAVEARRACTRSSLVAAASAKERAA